MPQNEPAVLEHIRRLGKFNVDNYKFYADPTFAIEDYICPNVDHELMYKCLQNGNGDAALLDDGSVNGLGVVVLDLEQQIVQLTVSESKELIAQSTRSIAGPDGGQDAPKTQGTDNVTDEQRIAKILIDNLNADLSQTLAAAPAAVDPNVVGCAGGVVSPKAKKTKRKGAKNSNNCGTINLKNISSLTINTMCSRENSVKKSSKVTATAPAPSAAAAGATRSSSTEPSTASTSSTVTPPPKSTSDVIMDTHSTMENTSNATGDGHGQCDGPIDFDCEFYNRLIADIKLTMKTPKGQAAKQQQQQRGSSPQPMTTSTSSASNTVTSSSLASPTSALVSPMSTASSSDRAATAHSHHECNKMLFQNIRNLQITLPAASAAWLQSKRRSAAPTATPQPNQPVQIEEWLKQIISEPEIEPSPSSDVLEHSLIHGTAKASE